MTALHKHRLFDHLSGKAIVIAVSGGGDSMALLDLYRLAQLQNPKLPKPIVATVDHGLRTSFAPEAALVETYCATHRLPWALLTWQGDKPKTGIMAAARLARYGLLAGFASSVDSQVILTGHTQDDQNETMTMRGSRGAVSAMESDVIFKRRTLISRPLLFVTRDELRQHLAQHEIAFADDPSNLDMRFERVRIRSADATASPTLPSLEVRIELIARAANFILQNVKIENGAALIQRPKVRDVEAEILAIRYLAATLGQFEYPAPQSVGSRLATLLDDGDNGIAYTAQRCRFVRTAFGISALRDRRHQNLSFPSAKISPFEQFCTKSMLPIANALAKTLGAADFILPNAASI